MSNTLIQIRKSTVTATPAILNIAEPAYSYSSNGLFIGTPGSDGAIKIGGYSEVVKLDAAFAAANAANAGTIAGSYDQANNAYAQANLVYGQANTAYNQANLVFDASNVVFTRANAGMLTANTGYIQANAGMLTANTAYIRANAAMLTANAAFDRANVANTSANFANTTAIAAFGVANTKLNSTGGTISGDLSVTGNLNVTGSFITFNTTNYLVQDPLLVLANNNISDVVDIGVIGQYQNGTSLNVYTGIYRDSGSKEWYIFDGYTDNFLANTNHINPAGNNFSVGVLNASIRTSNLFLGGANAILSISNALTVANFAFGHANTGYGQANIAYNQANLVYGQANTGYSQANLVFGQANTAYNQANLVFTHANTVFTRANAGMLTANTAYDKANSANINAADASFLTTGTVASARISGAYGGITGVGTIATGVWNGTVITVPYGGTGRATFANNGVIFGNTAGLLNATAAGTEGQVLQVNNNGVPIFGTIDGGNF